MHSRFICFVFAAAVCLPAFAEQPASARFDELLEQVRAERELGNAADRERERAFLERRDDRRRLLNEAESRLEQLLVTSDALEKRFNDNELRLVELRTLYGQRIDGFGELPDIFHSVVTDLEAQFSGSLAALGVPDWRRSLAEMKAQKNLPTSAQLDKLMLLFLELMRMQALNLRLETDVVSSGGDVRKRSVVRVGPFTAFAGGDFLSYLPGQEGEAGQLSELPQAPGSRYVDAATDFSRAGSGMVAAPVDLSRGSVLSLLVRSPTLVERIRQGGIVGYVILFIGLLGLLLGMERLVNLALLRRAVERQRGDPGNPRDNPLGRVLLACRAGSLRQDADCEVLELQLESAVMKEVPTLEKRLGTVRVLAAIAPLLGLLGTVAGMIETFQAVALFGTGNPGWMAGGISQALVTTALGLVVAVPLLLLYTAANAHSRVIREILEAQSAGLLAQYAERHAR